MDISIIILNYKTKELVKQCIRGIRNFAKPALSYEIIVVDNASGDRIGEMMKEYFPDIKLILTPANIGYAAGNNLGIKEAQGKYILILNPDIAVLEGNIEKMHQFMENNPQIGILGPRLVNPDGTTQSSCYRFPTFMTPIYRRTPLSRLSFAKKALDHYLMADYHHTASREVDWLLGACVIIRREAVDKVGLMDERFLLYFEDVDWCRRFWAAGHKVYYLAEAKMVHYYARLSAESSWLKSLLAKSTRTHIHSWIKYFRKWKNKNIK